jgi:putative SOS response-associated peptidase YedK
MPILLPERSWVTWLDPDNHDMAALQHLLADPADDAFLELRPVTTAVNNVRNNGPQLLEPEPST